MDSSLTEDIKKIMDTRGSQRKWDNGVGEGSLEIALTLTFVYPGCYQL